VFGLQSNAPLLLCLLAWVGVGVGLALPRGRGSGGSARRDRRSLVGLGIQTLSFSLVFVAQRQPAATLPPWEAALRWAGVLLAWGSAALAIGAVRVLGRHWSLEARVLPGHRLVREGPYAHVRHPIYAAMPGLMIGTGVNLTQWVALAGAAALYLVGTRLRVRAEDGLLRQQFGDEFDRYAAEVPGLWPGRPRQA